MADAAVSKTVALRRASSTLASGTISAKTNAPCNRVGRVFSFRLRTFHENGPIAEAVRLQRRPRCQTALSRMQRRGTNNPGAKATSPAKFPPGRAVAGSVLLHRIPERCRREDGCPDERPAPRQRSICQLTEIPTAGFQKRRQIAEITTFRVIFVGIWRPRTQEGAASPPQATASVCSCGLSQA